MRDCLGVKSKEGRGVISRLLIPFTEMRGRWGRMGRRWRILSGPFWTSRACCPLRHPSKAVQKAAGHRGLDLRRVLEDSCGFPPEMNLGVRIFCIGNKVFLAMSTHFCGGEGG